jgi:hypothetical protein
MRYFRGLLWAGLCLCFPLLAGAADDAYYLFQTGNWFAVRGDLNFETETDYGTRDTRLLGNNAMEQALAFRVAGTSWLSVDLWGAAAIPTSNKNAAESSIKQNYSFAGDVYARLLNQDGQAVNLSLGLGYLQDYNQTSIPRVHVTLDRSWGGFNAAFTALAQIPVSVSRATPNGQPALRYDDVDWIMTVAASYALVRFVITKGFSTRLNVGAVLPLTVSQPTSLANVSVPQNRVQATGGLAFTYVF